MWIHSFLDSGISLERCTRNSHSRLREDLWIKYWRKNSERTIPPLRCVTGVWNILTNVLNSRSNLQMLPMFWLIRSLLSNPQLRLLQGSSIFPELERKHPNHWIRFVITAVETIEFECQYWEEILNRRSKAVLLSFGSMAKSMLLSKQNKAGILHVRHSKLLSSVKFTFKAISQFPDITFIWKYEEPEDDFCKTEASKLNNLVLSKWMPQVDILSGLLWRWPLLSGF